MSGKIYVGIDPGLDGGLAVENGDTAVAIPMPTVNVGGGKREIDAKAVAEWLEAHGARSGFVVIEKVGAMPKQGVSSTFCFGEGYGGLKAVLRVMNYRWSLVTPQAWKKTVLSGFGTKDKSAAIEWCRRTYPALSLKATERCRTDHDGMADAVCMSRMARILEEGK